jgi:hypothetical protein
MARDRDGVETLFARDESIPTLGVGWRDPTGMIWGEIVKNEDGSLRTFYQREALEYCQALGLQLPSFDDLWRLRAYQGGTTERYAGLPDQGDYSGYSPQILLDHPDQYPNNFLWSSTPKPWHPGAFYVFRIDGYFSAQSEFRNDSAARCVWRPESR